MRSPPKPLESSSSSWADSYLPRRPHCNRRHFRCAVLLLVFVCPWRLHQVRDRAEYFGNPLASPAASLRPCATQDLSPFGRTPTRGNIASNLRAWGMFLVVSPVLP